MKSVSSISFSRHFEKEKSCNDFFSTLYHGIVDPSSKLGKNFQKLAEWMRSLVFSKANNSGSEGDFVFS
jgi:hypothetical protein